MLHRHLVTQTQCTHATPGWSQERAGGQRAQCRTRPHWTCRGRSPDQAWQTTDGASWCWACHSCAQQNVTTPTTELTTERHCTHYRTHLLSVSLLRTASRRGHLSERERQSFRSDHVYKEHFVANSAVPQWHINCEQRNHKSRSGHVWVEHLVANSATKIGRNQRSTTMT